MTIPLWSCSILPTWFLVSSDWRTASTAPRNDLVPSTERRPCLRNQHMGQLRLSQSPSLHRNMLLLSLRVCDGIILCGISGWSFFRDVNDGNYFLGCLLLCCGDCFPLCMMYDDIIFQTRVASVKDGIVSRALLVGGYNNLFNYCGRIYLIELRNWDVYGRRFIFY